MSEQNPLEKLASTELDLLPEKWQDPQRQEIARQARELDGQSTDAYWEWAAKQFRWMTPWQSVREGGFPDFEFFSGGYLNIADNCIDRHAENPELADTPAVIWEGEPVGDSRTLTFSELKDEVSRCANAFKSLGIKKGDVVALYMQNLPEAYVVTHACSRIGAIYTILFSGFPAEAIVSRLETAQPKLIVTADKSYRRGRDVALLQTWREAQAQCPSVEHTLVIDRSGTQPALEGNEQDYRSLLDSQSSDCPCEPVEANAPSCLVFTSGTTSKPKGVVHSTAGFMMGAWANAYWQLGSNPGQVCWCATDVGWLTFPIQSLLGGLATGATQVCFEGSLDYPDNQRFYQIAKKYQIQKIITAPTVIRMLRGYGDELAAQYPLPDFDVMSVQGEPLDATSYNWAREKLGSGVPVINAYGQTETGSTWIYPIWGVDDTKAGSCGTPVPGYRGRIVDDEGNDVADGQRGHLVISEPLPSMARSIWNDHERYKESYFSQLQGAYWCSDEGMRDEDGHIWVLGRSDDVINVAGHRLSTVEIETAVTAHPAVIEAAVMGVSDELKGLVPVTFVCLAAGTDAAAVAAELKQRVQEGIGGIARLEAVYVTQALPKTRTGKTVRRLLIEIVEQGKTASDTSSLEDISALDACIQAKKL
ncbi:MAG: AMP-binding protein [Candidatus Reddybacter sp.]